MSHRAGPPARRVVVRQRYGCPHAWPIDAAVTLAEIAQGRYHECWLARDHALPHRCHCDAHDPEV